MNVIAVKNHLYCRKKSIVHNNWILRTYHSHANFCGFWSQCSRSTECSTFWLMMYFNLWNILPQYTLHSHKVFPCKWVAFMGSLLWKYSVLLLLCLSVEGNHTYTPLPAYMLWVVYALVGSRLFLQFALCGMARAGDLHAIWDTYMLFNRKKCSHNCTNS
jgi:hypothetical protein